jgi:hypothetical protein
VKTHRRSFAVLALLAVAALALTSVALAGSSRDRHHKRNHQVAQKDVKNEQVKRHRTFAPTKIIGAPEASAVLLDPLTHQFVQVTFDRGRVTATTSNSITLQQQQGGVVWRTQTFTVAAAPTSNTTSNTTTSTSALVSLNGHGAQLTQIPIGSSARVESTGTPGGAMSVVRVQAFSHGEAPLPATS